MREDITRAVQDLVDSTYAIALTGAGISTESGIPDFRGPSGVWTKNPEAERRAYRSYERFLEDPKGWWEERLANPGVLGNLESAMPNPGHYALAELEKLDAVRCVITQNVDGLHEKAGSKNVIEYHGSVLKMRCISCSARFSRDQFDLEKLRRNNQLPPSCPTCGGVIKTDGVAFGEPIPHDVADRSMEEVRKSDLMLICGTSAVVFPFANLPRMARQKGKGNKKKAGKGPEMTIIEINAESTPLTIEGISDYLVQGKTGEILPVIVEEVKRLRMRGT